MKYTYQQVKDSYPKNHQESFFTRYVCRPLSFPISYLLVNLGCSAWLVSVFSIFVALLACLFLCMPNELRWIGIVGCILWLILDCVDGNIARVSKSYSAMGDFIDAQSGYTIMAFVFFANGIAAYHTTYLFEGYKIWFIIIGSLSSISNILARLLNAKFSYCDLELKVRKEKEIKLISYDNPEGGFARVRAWIDFNIGLVGLFIPFMIISQFFDIFDVLTLFYFAYSLLGFFVASAYYAWRAK